MSERRFMEDAAREAVTFLDDLLWLIGTAEVEPGRLLFTKEWESKARQVRDHLNQDQRHCWTCSCF